LGDNMVLNKIINRLREKGNNKKTIILMCCILLIVMILGSAIGAVYVPFFDTVKIILTKWGVMKSTAFNRGAESIIYYVRFPRVLVAALVGSALATSGAVMQGMFRNPMADPGIIGVSSGASLGAITAISLGMIIGGLVVSVINNRLKKSTMIVFGNAGVGIVIALLCLPAFQLIKWINPLYFSTFLYFIIGLCIVFITAPLRTYLFQYTPKEIMGRVIALLSMVSLSLRPIGSALGGIFASFIPMSILFLFIGISVFIISFLPLLNKEFRKE